MFLVTPRSTNSTTGDIPQVWIGPTLADAHASCERSGCPYWPALGGHVKCYAWHGSPSLAFCAVLKRTERDPEALTFQAAPPKALCSAHFVRFTALGDASAETEETWRAAREACLSARMKPLGYTAGWRFAPWLRSDLRASVSTDAEADEASALGWRLARVGPADMTELPDGERHAVVCPNKLGARVTCNTCGICTSRISTVWFPHHGSSAKKESKS